MGPIQTQRGGTPIYIYTYVYILPLREIFKIPY